MIQPSRLKFGLSWAVGLAGLGVAMWTPVWTSAWAQPAPDGAAEPAVESAAATTLEPCHLAQYRQEALCGSHTVFEDRAAGTGRQIDIRFAVIPAVDEKAEADPLVFFAGGPGQAAMDTAAFIVGVFPNAIKSRDVVLIDQRGMGSSHPLRCEQPEAETWSMTAAEQKQLMAQILTDCLTELDADVTLYTQDLANEDIHEVLLTLGYEKVNLYGVSWGTRSALLYAHRYPEHVRTLILDGSLPLANPAPSNAAADAERALEELFTDCAADEPCHAAFPDLRREFDTALQLLGDQGRSITVDDPRTGEPRTFILTHDMFGEIFRSVLYSAELSRLIPLMIRQAAVSDYRALVGVGDSLLGSMADTMTVGASLSIFCSEELARLPATTTTAATTAATQAVASEDQVAGTALQPRLLGNQMLGNIEDACKIWPSAALPEIYNEAVSSSAPALILSGQVDPITPPRWGEQMHQVLPNSMHLVAPATGHNVGPAGCASRLMEQLIEQGDSQDLDGSCLEELRRPTFFIDTSGPRVVAADGASGEGDASAEGAVREEANHD